MNANIKGGGEFRETEYLPKFKVSPPKCLVTTAVALIYVHIFKDFPPLVTSFS